MRGELTSQIEKDIMPLIREMSIEIVELSIKRRGKTAVLDVIADHPNGGITLDECAFINKQIVSKLEENQCLGGDFIVEVSSPGIDRALRTSKDFLRIIGRNIRIHLTQPIENKIEHHGKVTSVNEVHITLQACDHLTTIPLNIVGKAVQLISENRKGQDHGKQ